jgi:chromate transporter
VSEHPPDGTNDARSAEGPPLRAFLRYFVGLGTWGFGGPIATVGYMQRDLVEGRTWVTERDFLNGVALGQTMPGPLAAQVVMWVGYLQRGALGALGTSTLFILPSFVVVLGVAIVYVRFQGLAVVQALFYGISPAVIALIAVASVKLARLTDKSDTKLWTISLVVAVVTAVTGAEIGLMFIAAGLLMILLEAPPKLQRLRRRERGEPGETTARSVALLASSTSFKVLTGTATAGTLVALGLFFLKAGAFIFGSGLAIVPFLQSGVVDQHHWLTQQQFLDAVAMGLITPGPVVITATFIGYLIGGMTGALVATIAIFIPIYLGVVIPGRWFVRHRDHPQLKAFVRGATAAAAGAIAGATVVLAKGAIVDVETALIALGGLAFVLRFKNREPILVLLAAIAGLVLKGT